MKGFLLFLFLICAVCVTVLADELRIIDLDDWFPEPSFSSSFDSPIRGYTWRRFPGSGESEIERALKSTTDYDFFEVDIEGHVKSLGKIRAGLFGVYLIP